MQVDALKRFSLQENWVIICWQWVQGCKPPEEKMDVSTPPSDTSPTNSYPGASESLIPWLKAFSSENQNGGANGMSMSMSRTSSGLPPLHVKRAGSASAPVTPPISSPRAANPVKPEWDAVVRDGLPEYPNHPLAWTQHSFLAAAAVAAQAATGGGGSSQSHLWSGYCDTPEGARTPVEGYSESHVAPATALEFVCSPNSGKWTNGVRVRMGGPVGGSASTASRITGRVFGDTGVGGPFRPPQSDGVDDTFSHQWRNPMQKSISVPVSPVSSRMRSVMGDRLARCPPELDLDRGPVQRLGALWELDSAPEVVGSKRKVTADHLELTLGNSSLRAL
jgi:hypothetical protein